MKVILDLDPRTVALVTEAHRRFRDDVAPLELPAFIEVCVVEYLQQQTPDLHRVALGAQPC